MRKIKITALLLAVLMIVTAFAGCASKSTVTNLDNKVNDLDASIEEQKAALSGIESTLATISKALENQGSSDNLDEVIKDIEEAKQNDAAIADSIKDLQAAIEDLKKEDDKEPEVQAPVVAGDVVTAIGQNSAKLEAFEGTIDDDKDNYTAETLAAIRDIIGKAEAAIAAGTSAEDINKVYEDTVAEITAKYPSVNGKLYNYVVELKGNITDESADTVADAEKALKDAIKFYETTGKKEGAQSDALVKYEVSKTEEMNLINEINKLVDAQRSTLITIKDEAARLTKAIDAIDDSYSFDKVSEIYVQYKIWAQNAEKLSPKNVELVKNYDKLEAAQASSLKTHAAMKYLSEAKIFSQIADTVIAGRFESEIAVFDDYEELANIATNGQVLFIFDTEDANGKTVKALTSKIYAAIDAELEKWQADYSLTDAAAEYVINTLQGDTHFYAKYKADRALVNAFEDEYEKFVAADGVFTAIKALNDERVDADAIEVALAFEKNAWDIQNWKEAQEKAYAAQLAAVADLKDVSIDTNVEFATVLVANFNAMVEFGKLCQFNGDIKNPVYGLEYIVSTTNPDEAYDLNNDKVKDDKDYYYNIYNELQGSGEWVKEYKYDNLYSAGFKTLDELNPRTYYFELYDFSNTNLVDFILRDYRNAKVAAKVINDKIDAFKPEQAISIRSIVEGIGGYVALNGTNDKLLAVETIDIKNSISGSYANIKNIAQFEYEYDTTKVYDLTPLLKLADYEAKLALVEKHIKAAAEVAAELNGAYAALVGNKPTVLVTMDNIDDIAEVYNIYSTKWLKLGRNDMSVATELSAATSGVKQYKLESILAPCAAIKAQVTDGTNRYKVLDSTSGMIVKLSERAAKLKAESNLVLSAYKMLDAMYAFNKGSFNLEVLSNPGYIPNMYSGGQNNAYVYGIVGIDVSEAPMTDDGVDASGKGYKKDQYKWTVKYVTFDKAKAEFVQGTYDGYYYGNDKTKLNDNVVKALNADLTPNKNMALADDLVTKGIWSTGTTAFTGLADNTAKYDAVSTEVLVNIPTYVENNDIAELMSNTVTGTSMVDKIIPAYALATLALELDARFQVDNYGEYAPIADARKAFDPTVGGYGFNFIKGITFMKLMADIPTLADAHQSAVKLASDIESLSVVTNAAVIESAQDGRINNSDYINLNIDFGGFAGITAPFNIESDTIFENALYLRDFGLKTLNNEDFKVPGIIIYAHCNHSAMVGGCIHNAGVCADCGETISGVVNADLTVKNVNVGTPFQGKATQVDVLVRCNDCALEETFEVLPGVANELTITDGDGVNTTVGNGDTITFKFTYHAVEYTITATFDGTVWNTDSVAPSMVPAP